MGRITAIANQKGGVGKTTTAVNLGACMAASGKRVLLVDMDPQGNATSAVGVQKAGLEHTIYEALVLEHPLSGAVLHTDYELLDLIPANKELSGAEVELIEADRREFRLRAALQPLRDSYDYIYIDCPPALNLLTVNALAGTDEVLVTLQCEYFALEGLSELVRTIDRVRENLNPGLRFAGVLFTMYQHTNLANMVISDVRAHFGAKAFEAIIPRNVSLAEASSYGQPIIYYDLKSAGARAYNSLAREVVARG